MSSDGIDELARSEEAKDLAFEDAGLLKSYARLFYAFSAITGSIFIAVEGITAIIVFEIWCLGLIAMAGQLLQWHLKHSETCVEFDGLKEATSIKNNAAFTLIGLMCLATLLVWLKI